MLLMIVALLCAPAFAQPIQACQCREYGTPTCAQFWRSDAVFVGQVVKNGKRHLVYASLDDKTNQLFTGMCTGTTLAVDTDDTLKELRKLKQREVEESISGRIKTNRYQGLPGIRIEVISKDKTLKTMTTKNGDFSVSLPGPGSFTVRVSVPYAALLMDNSDDVTVRSTQTESLSTLEYDVTLEKSQCSYLELDLYGTDPRATATVAGNVLTPTGQAVDKSAVSLINRVDTGPDYVELFKEDGSFRFESVAPGEYHLVLNARNGFDSS